MICRCLAGACLLLVVAAGAEAGVDLQHCVNGSDGARLSLRSWRNNSGHWQATVRLEHSAPAGRPARRISLKVDPSSWRCGPIRTDAITVHIEGQPPPPGPGYVKLGRFGFYKIHPEISTWENAKVACENEDAHLLVLNSQAEADAILGLIKRTPNLPKMWLHIGFHDKIQEGHYVTIFGETLAEAGYSRWRAGDPTNLPTEDCGGISKEVELVDIGCEDHIVSFICEHYFS